MIDKLDPTFRFYQDAANLRAHRQQLIASNIANADTPKFKARDIDFKDALQGAMAGNGANTAGRLARKKHSRPSIWLNYRKRVDAGFSRMATLPIVRASRVDCGIFPMRRKRGRNSFSWRKQRASSTG